MTDSLVHTMDTRSPFELAPEHIGVAAREPRRLADWYCLTLGGSIIWISDYQPPACFVRLVGGLVLEIYSSTSETPLTADNKLAGWRHLALSVRDIESAQNYLARRGVTFSESVKPAGGGGRVLFFSDPEGNLLHLVERPAGTAFPRPGPPSAVIFDMDGVIVDSEPRHERAFLQVFSDIGYADRHQTDFAAYYGRSDKALWKDFILQHQPIFSLEELTLKKRDHFFDLIRAERPIFAPIPNLIRDLATKYRLAVASGSSHDVIDVVLEMQELRTHFQAVVSSDDVLRGKPEPDVFLRAAEKLGVQPQDCWVIEDSVAGVQAGLSAGMRVIAITNSFPAEKLSHAHVVVRTYDEIRDHLLRLE